MNVNLRCDDTFVQDEGWYQANDKYHDFVESHSSQHILYLELGVGMNTPAIIKYPFWQKTAHNKKAVYACVNYGEAYCPKEIEERSICIDEDLQRVISELA
ncbi:MAG: hypothetical protein NC413_13015 [Muribaculum sp.]|nr:hypothetical protein [Muribaculum sp.]